VLGAPNICVGESYSESVKAVGSERSTVSMSGLDQLFDQFLRERTYVYNVTPKTRDWYESAWHAFKRSQPRMPTEITKAHLLAFVVHLRERGVKPVSCNTWLRAMNAFCRSLHEQGEAATLVKPGRSGLRSGSFAPMTKQLCAWCSAIGQRPSSIGASTH
jgi:hypothetical protein